MVTWLSEQMGAIGFLHLGGILRSAQLQVVALRATCKAAKRAPRGCGHGGAGGEGRRAGRIPVS